MPNFFIIGTHEDHAPLLAVSQGTHEQALERITRFERGQGRVGYQHFYVYAVQALPPTYNYPEVGLLLLTDHIKPENIAQYYHLALGHELDNMPQEQALNQLQSALDYLDKKRIQIEGRAVLEASKGTEVPTQTAQTS